MPFKNRSQMKACFAKDDPKWDCKKWAHETDTKHLPKMKEFVEFLKENDISTSPVQNLDNASRNLYQYQKYMDSQGYPPNHSHRQVINQMLFDLRKMKNLERNRVGSASMESQTN